MIGKSPTSTGDFSNSTGSSVTNHRFFPVIVPCLIVAFGVQREVVSRGMSGARFAGDW